jgi:MFS family permease
MSRNSIAIKYALIFTGIYALGIVVANIITTIFSLEIGNSLNIGILMGTIAAIAVKFAKEQQRKPERKEKLFISLLSLAGAMVVSILAMVAVAILDQISISELFAGLSLPILLSALFFTLVIYFGAIYFVFGLFVSIFLKQINKAK